MGDEKLTERGAIAGLRPKDGLTLAREVVRSVSLRHGGEDSPPGGGSDEGQHPD